MIEDSLKFPITKCIYNLRNKELKKTNSTAILSLRVLSAAILSLCEDAFMLLEKKHVFTACSLTCQAIEAQIQLLCIDKLFETKGRDYYEFAFVEQLRSLEMSPQWQENTLKRMQNYQCERFFNGKGKNTLDINSYHKHWYQSFANTIKDMGNIAFPHLKNILISHNINVFQEYNDINILYENYQTLCGFKHFSPFIVGDTYRVQKKFFEDPKTNHEKVALICIYIILISTIFILNNHNEKIPTDDCLITLEPFQTSDE